MTRLYLVRHATHGLVDRALAGRMDGVALSPDGEIQALRLGGFFSGREVAAVLSSPLERCRSTAAAIAGPLGLPVSIEDALTELDCGEWTGRSFEELREDPRWGNWNTERGRGRMPGGESTGEVQARIMALLSRLQEAGAGPTVLVSHSDVIKVAILSLLDSPLDRHDRIVVDPASITTVELWSGGGKVVRTNEVVP